MSDTLQTLFNEYGISDAAKQGSTQALLARTGMTTSGPPPMPLVSLDPLMIKANPATYQFRASYDSATGVTAKGRYEASHWNPVIHGDPLLVHERLDGTMFVADGHHRLELAQRLTAQGTGPKNVAAYVFREVDGYTAEDAKIIAAYKNLAHGGSDIVEAARVFKEVHYSTTLHKEWLPQLPMDKTNLKMSYSLSKLSDTSLEMVARGDVPAEMAAKVPEMVQAPQEHEPVMQALAEKLRATGFVATLNLERTQAPKSLSI